MDAYQLFRSGKLSEAIVALQAALRENAQDQRSRTFLFELLCFAGDFGSAEEHLKLLVQKSRKESLLGTMLYRSMVRAEKNRQSMFELRKFPDNGIPHHQAPSAIAGKLNGKEFHAISDSDHRIGEKLEVFINDDYLWVPYADIASMQVEPPTRLRDLLWIPAHVNPVASSTALDMRDIMIPSMAPLSWQHPDEEVRLGRVSEWCEDESGEVAPYGLKTILVDGEEVPVVEIRELEIYPVTTNVHQA